MAEVEQEKLEVETPSESTPPPAPVIPPAASENPDESKALEVIKSNVNSHVLCSTDYY